MKRLIASLIAILMIAGLLPLTAFAADAPFTPTKRAEDNNLFGDVDADGSVTQKDRLILTRYLAGWSGYGSMKSAAAADINEDGSITAVDRILLGRFLSRWEGYEEYFKAEEPDPLSPASVYQSIIAMKGEYYEGRPWTNADQYVITHFPPYSHYTGFGCVAFCLIMSDAAFGDLPLRQIDKGDFTYDDLRTGDIIRMYNDGHSMIILEVLPDHIVVAEGNYNSSIHWGRTIKKDEVMTADYIWTRYPE